MKKTLLLLLAIMSTLGVYAQASEEAAAECGPFKFRSYTVLDTAEAHAWGDTFKLSDNYPLELPDAPAGGFPWEKIDFKTQPMEYADALLSYTWEGMDTVNWVAQNNPVRTWYHAPWLDYGYAGREYIRGLVMDRTSYENELALGQTRKYRNYSITLYNPRGGYGLGQVWCNPNNPDPAKADFPEGTVITKLTFTTADTSEVPHLRNAMEWLAAIERATELPIDNKQDGKVRLLQIEVGVKTSKAPHDWVFALYVYNGKKAKETVRERFTTIGLQWGNDPGVLPAEVRDGTKQLQETFLNLSAWDQENLANSLIQKPGWGYRLGGPIGNFRSSVFARNMTAGFPPAPEVPLENIEMDSMMSWYVNPTEGQPFRPGQTMLDFSLELRDGIRNFKLANGDESLQEGYDAYINDMLGFVPPDRTVVVQEEEEVIVDVDEGLEGRNMYVFIGFIVLVIVLIGGLVYNLMKDK